MSVNTYIDELEKMRRYIERLHSKTKTDAEHVKLALLRALCAQIEKNIVGGEYTGAHFLFQCELPPTEFFLDGTLDLDAITESMAADLRGIIRS